MTGTVKPRPRPYAGFPPAAPEDAPMPAGDGKLSVLIPVYNEEGTVGDIIARVLALGPVVKEVVVVDDGSKDRTVAVLAEAFDLVEVPKVIPDLVPVVGDLLSVHLSRQGHPLTVVRKTSIGSKADANNLGINARSITEKK